MTSSFQTTSSARVAELSKPGDMCKLIHVHAIRSSATATSQDVVACHDHGRALTRVELNNSTREIATNDVSALREQKLDRIVSRLRMDAAERPREPEEMTTWRGQRRKLARCFCNSGEFSVLADRAEFSVGC